MSKNAIEFESRFFVVHRYGIIDYDLPDDAKVIFLDIDGVLNSGVYAEEFISKKLQDDPEHYHIWCDQVAVKKLADFCEKHDVQLVISSSWRRTNDIQSTVNRMRDIPGFEPIINYICGQTGRKGVSRGDQIKNFVDNYGIKNYAIVDDNTDMRDDQLDRFVFVDSCYGLRLDEYYDEIKERLGINEMES